MQLFTPVWLGACLASSVLASSGRVFLWDSARTVAHGVDVPSVDPETARLILAQRLGLEQFHSIPEDDGQALDLLNRFGVAGSLFETTRSASRHPRALIVIEGLEEPEQLVTDDRFAQFELGDVPDDARTEQLLKDFTTQATYLAPEHAEGRGIGAYAFRAMQHFLSEGDWKLFEHHDGKIVLHLAGLSDIATTKGSTSPAYKDALARVGTALEGILTFAQDESMSVTVAALPRSLSSGSRSSYGTYQLPKREVTYAEAPLSASSSAAHPQRAKPDEAESLEAGPSGIIPTCFSSLSACESGTRNCTGHGECILKYKTQGDDPKSCYACACTKPVVRTNKEGGKKTTYFGGPACQKEDVSVAFWLIAGFTIFIIFVVSTGVGLLYSMGSEELPSVLGSGVSGPRAK